MRRSSRAVYLAILICTSTPAALAAEEAAGIVYDDANANGVFDPGEPGVAGVPVSNGLDVVLTGEDGRYRLPVEDGTVLFITKPAGYAVPLDERNIRRFYVIHDPDGTPPGLGLRYEGVRPTGPLPASVDFALRRAEEPDPFTVIFLADTQPQSAAEMEFVRDEVVTDLIGTDAAFGFTLGDIMYDDLSLFPRYNDFMARIGIPWHNVPGNHDMNFLAPDDAFSLETFKQTFGPTYYSFDHGRVHFVVLDTIHYLGRDDGHPRGAGEYEVRVGGKQLAWLENDLRHVPMDRLVVLAMHGPIWRYGESGESFKSVDDVADLLALLEGRRVMSIAGHFHAVEHHYLGPEEGFEGPEPLHVHTIGTVSGSWWSGPIDARGIPFAMQRDGTPNGYSLMTVSGDRATMRYRAASEGADHQMRIVLDSAHHRYREELLRDYRPGELLSGPITMDQVHSTEVVVNLFDGGPRSRVELQAGEDAPIAMERVFRRDPFAEEVFTRHQETVKPWVKALPSSHLWVAPLPRDLGTGVHTLTVRAVDEYGQEHIGHRIIEILER